MKKSQSKSFLKVILGRILYSPLTPKIRNPLSKPPQPVIPGVVTPLPSHVPVDIPKDKQPVSIETSAPATPAATLPKPTTVQYRFFHNSPRPEKWTESTDGWVYYFPKSEGYPWCYWYFYSVDAEDIPDPREILPIFFWVVKTGECREVVRIT